MIRAWLRAFAVPALMGMMLVGCSTIGPYVASGEAAVNTAAAAVQGAFATAAAATFGKADPWLKTNAFDPATQALCRGFTWQYAQKAFDANFDVKTLPAPNCGG